MSASFSKGLRLVLIILVCLATPIVRAGDFKLDWNAKEARVTADIEDVPVRTVLIAIQRATGWEISVEPGLQKNVSTSFRDFKTGRALDRLLSEINFALIPGDNASSRLLVFSTSREKATEALVAPTDDDAIPDELIVTLKDGVDAETLAAQLGATVEGAIDEFGVYRLKFKDAQAAETARKALANNQDVLGVDTNHAIKQPVSELPANGAESQVRLPTINPAGAAGGPVTVGVVDTAIQIPKGMLGEYFLPQVSIADVVQADGVVPTHGTSMANDILYSMAGALGDGSINIRILPVDVYGSGEGTSTFQLGQGLVTAWNNGSTVINVSSGSQQPNPWLDRIINELTARGAVIFAPAGNTPNGLPTYPAANPNVYAVTATGNDGRSLAPYANNAAFVDIAMPGTSLVNLTGQPYIVTGTSGATAKATGTTLGIAQQLGIPPQKAVQILIQAKPAPH